ncbi:hypothetical protein M426DRAFT_72848 [Hypoxylon sp. CI-4A]|nr:hypothetical protein M426DRAFT_72848 [Hypoxylon sp. CI-4A]
MSTTKGTIIVTGVSTGGLGSTIAQEIASKPEFSVYHGVYTVRDKTRAPALTAGDTHPHEFVSLDLSSLDNVRQVANDINTRVSAGDLPPIRALILNAGFQDFGQQMWTDDGFDKTFTSNYMGHWLLTLLLLKSMNKEEGRIIILGSQSHDPADPRHAATKAYVDPKYQPFVTDAASFEAIARGTWSPAREDGSFRSGFRRYGAAKLFLIMMQHELQARLDASDTSADSAALSRICVVGVDPGAMITGMPRLAGWFIRVLIFQVIYPVVQYFNPDGGVRPTSKASAEVLEAAFGIPESRDAEKRRLVWRETARFAGLEEGESVLVDWR